MTIDYNHINIKLQNLVSLSNKQDEISAKKLSEELLELDDEMKTFLASKPNLSKEELISLMARVDSLFFLVKKQSEDTKQQVVKINKQIQAKKGYKAK